MPIILGYPLLMSSRAFAYAGQQLLEFAAGNIIGPLGLFAIIFAVAATQWRPEYVHKAVAAAIACGFIFFLIRSAPALLSAMGG